MHEGGGQHPPGLRGWPRVAEDIIVARDLLLTEAVGGGALSRGGISSMVSACALLAEKPSREA